MKVISRYPCTGFKYDFENFFFYLLTSGNHCTVRLGHSRACVMTRSQRKGVFFFHILYSSFITRSSTASSYTRREQEKQINPEQRSHIQIIGHRFTQQLCYNVAHQDFIVATAPYERLECLINKRTSSFVSYILLALSCYGEKQVCV